MSVILILNTNEADIELIRKATNKGLVTGKDRFRNEIEALTGRRVKKKRGRVGGENLMFNFTLTPFILTPFILARQELKKQGAAERISFIAGDDNAVDLGHGYDLIWASNLFDENEKNTLAISGSFHRVYPGRQHAVLWTRGQDF